MSSGMSGHEKNSRLKAMLPDCVVALWEGPQLLLAKVKDADRQDWYIYLYETIMTSLFVEGLVLKQKLLQKLKFYMHPIHLLSLA